MFVDVSRWKLELKLVPHCDYLKLCELCTADIFRRDFVVFFGTCATEMLISRDYYFFFLSTFYKQPLVIWMSNGNCKCAAAVDETIFKPSRGIRHTIIMSIMAVSSSLRHTIHHNNKKVLCQIMASIYFKKFLFQSSFPLLMARNVLAWHNPISE